MGDQVYYEVVGSEIYRVGVKPKAGLIYTGGHGTIAERMLKRFDYVVVGDASIIEGLAAPYDEEETNQVVHIEKPDASFDLFEFWLKNQNSDQVTSRQPEPRVFSK